ncbi:hypothetical protein CASFOL_036337 [Castilleja foliolosa]|uniref:VQ domain-containing protein n=1 Tax=Castilleja foliolosa TaxID=1961234 RepID=A0ABD3BVB1_9LAMI
MDSGNSASKQSTNGGDDQDLLDSSSSFLNPTFFDPPKHTNNLDQHDLIWSTGLRSQQNYYPNFGNSSSIPSRTQSKSSPSQPDAHALGPRASLRPDHQLGVIKNPKKRSRASHRPTTTVLQTDPTNFRQMVQEFTGFPAASLPGTQYSRPPELFSAAVRPGAHLDTPGPIYHTGPFSPLYPSMLNSTMIDSIVTTANIIQSDRQEIRPCATPEMRDNDIVQKH